ncbi:Ig-like domain-containing protein [Streptomyces sp. NPDC059875]|uniref:Ig-like domain-containing protein n=1 Tax=unclassified Streptomyces TaxID=2593676 RepID=UPI00365898F1
MNPRKPSQVAVMQGCTVYIDNNYGKDGFPITRTSTIAPCNGDPSLAFDSQGRLFVTHLSRSTALNNTGMLGVGVARIADLTTTGNQTYTPIRVSQHSASNHDKQWLVADANPASPHADNLYIVWTHLTAPSRILFSRSEDQGANWSAPSVISAGGEGFVWPSHLAVAHNGDLYVAYHTDTCGAANTGTIQLLRDGSGGDRFAAGTVPQKTAAFAAGGATVSCNRQDNSGDEIPGTDFWLQGTVQPWVLPDPARPGHVYVVANDDPNNTFANGDDADVVIARSTDNGLTFTRSRVDHSPGQTFAVMPTAHIDQDGNIAVQWYDNRSGDTNGGTGPNGNDNLLLEVYGTASRDGGLTWSNDFQISDAPFDPDTGAPCRFGSPVPPCQEAPGDAEQTLRIGEYNGIWTVDGIGYATWTGNATPPVPGTSNAAGAQTTYFDTFSLLGAFPDPLEPNESIDTAVAAGLGSDDRFNQRRLSLHSASDVDFFRVVPRHTGHVTAEIAFNEVISGLVARAYDKFGNKVATGATTKVRTGSSISELAIPVVKDEPYFVVVSDGGITDPTKPGDASPTDPPQATYDLTVVNREAPEPFGLDLKRESDSGRFDNDDVTSVTGPELFLRVDDADLRAAGIALSPQSGVSALVDDAPGFKVAVERDGERVGFAQPVNAVTKPGLYEIDLDAGTLTEGENLITAEVVIVDPSDDPAVSGTAHVVGSGNESAHRLAVTLDTTAPTAPAAPDLLESSDTGGNSIDNITTITEPAFQGSPVEPNALVRLTADPSSATGPTVVGKDTATSAGAYEVVSDALDDGTYDVAVRLEDLAGNVSAPSPSLAVTIAKQSLTLTGATADLVVDVDQNKVTGYPGIPGGFVGIRGIPVVNLDAAGHRVTLQGGAGDESLTFTPLTATSGRLERSNSGQVINLTNALDPVSVNPNGGDDEVTLVGTTGADSIFGTVDLLTLLRVQGLLGLEIATAQTERIGVNARGGRDTVDISALNTISARLTVNGGPPATATPQQGDTLTVRGTSPQDQLQNAPGGPNSGEGSAFIRYPQTTGTETRVDYTETERVILDNP